MACTLVFVESYTLFKFTGSHRDCESGSFSEMMQGGHAVTAYPDRKCHMAYHFVSFAMTLNDLESDHLFKQAFEIQLREHLCNISHGFN